ncbi:PAS domain S-box family protein [Ichthyophthirius multifiliis]|uniref:PAS domain S-box family protein n=1 Tax=Ichthyophthirius multifiliis TaxID=5932 RepID=G0QTQ9_ICHMU|nr:PAS domain S-box family protein [Ichthyophthirius multifiliis]EGR31396.1 PAS domain S-box family protein [Ichthyophthirius multifiliis]|eukprot:XP_004034882.1 PAS domain S-box family protein [Ichthyophthirius multifiliis]
MNVNDKNAYLNESFWESLERKLKKRIHLVVFDLLQNQSCSSLLYYVLILIETLQLLYYSVHPLANQYLWNTSFLSTIQIMLQYFQFNYLLFKSQKNIGLTLLYISCSISIVCFILFIVAMQKLNNQQNKSQILITYMVKILSIFGLLINTIIALPMFNAFIVFIICKSDLDIHKEDGCYSGIFFVHFAFSIISLIYYIALSLIFILLFIDLNPSSQLPFASPQTQMPIIKFCIKIILPLYATIDSSGQFVKQFIIILCIIYLLLVFSRYRTLPYYNKNVQRLVVYCECLLFWVTFCSTLIIYTDAGTTNNIGLIFMIICFPFIAMFNYQILYNRNYLLLKKNVSDFKKDIDAEMYIVIIIDLIQHIEITEQRILLEGILKVHNRQCQKEICYCRLLLNDDTKNDESVLLIKKWYGFIKFIIEDSLQIFHKSTRLHLLHSYIQHEKLKNRFKALYELMICNELKPNMQEEFALYRFNIQIENEMKDYDERIGDNINVDVNKVVMFQKKFFEFQAYINESVQLHLDFWRQLLEENPEIQKIEQMGSTITTTVDNLQSLYLELKLIYPNHIKSQEIYGNFLKDIVNDTIEAEKILDSVKYTRNSYSMTRTFQDADKLKYGENSNAAIITVSGNYNQMGIVQNVNNELTRILGWSKQDILKQNISKIMPKVYSELHDAFLSRFLETSESKLLGMERIVLAMKKNKFLVPCTIMIKILPNLDEGITIVGFLKDIQSNNNMIKNTMNQTANENYHYLIYRTDNHVLQGITQSCYQSLGIPASLMYGNSQNNIEFTIVRMNLIEHQEFDDKKLNVVKFIELDDSDIHIMNSGENQGIQTSNIQNDHNQQSNFSQQQVIQQSVSHEQNVKQNEPEIITERESNVSNEEAQNEARQIKEFKQLISEKSVPKRIKILQATFITLLLVLLSITGTELSYKKSQTTIVKQGTDQIYYSYMRQNIMADVNYQTRKIWAIAKQNKNKKLFHIYINFIYLVNQLQEIQFEIIKRKVNLDQNIYNTLEKQIYNIKFELQNGQSKEYENTFTDAMIQYITAASALTNTTIQQLKQSQTQQQKAKFIDSTQKNFYYIVQNGLSILRQGSEKLSIEIYYYYYNKIIGLETIFIVLMALGISFVILSQFVLIPIIFQIQSANIKVLSLFGMIHISEIKELASKCEVFTGIFLEEQNLAQSKQKINNVQNQNTYKTVIVKNEVEINNEKQDEENHDVIFKEKNLTIPNKNDIKNNINNSTLNNQSQLNQSTIPHQRLNSSMQNKKEVNKNNEEEEYDNLSNIKIMQLKDDNKKQLFFNFQFLCLFLQLISQLFIQLNQVFKQYQINILQFKNKQLKKQHFKVFFIFLIY